MEQNKTGRPAFAAGRYFKYAIGEILLVVIGILIALQINNWNENRKSQINQEKYFILLKKEAGNNLTNIQKARGEIQRRMDDHVQIMKILNSKQETISDTLLAQLFGNVLFKFTRLEFENSVLTEFMATGELKNFNNDSIRSKLVRLEPLIYKLRSQEANIKSDYEKTREILVLNGKTRRVYNNVGWSTSLGLDQSLNKTSNKTILKIKTF